MPLVPFVMLPALLLAASLFEPTVGERVQAAAVLLATGEHHDAARDLVAAALDELREPDGRGGYRWASWQPGGGPRESRSERVRGLEPAAPERFSVTAARGSDVIVRVPRKRSLFSGNYPCTVTAVTWRCPAWARDEKVLSSPRRLGRGEELSFALGAVCPELEVEVEAIADPAHRGDSELELAIEAGHLEDDRRSPRYPIALSLARFLSSDGSDTEWSERLALAARDLGERPRALRSRLERIRVLLDGSAREQRRGIDELDALIDSLP